MPQGQRYDNCMPDQHTCTPHLANTPRSEPSCEFCCSLTGHGFNYCGGAHHKTQLNTLLYMGCFVDQPDRTLPYYKGTGHTRSSCQDACARDNRLYLDLQYNGQCFCGNKAPLVQVDFDACNTRVSQKPRRCGVERGKTRSTKCGTRLDSAIRLL